MLRVMVISTIVLAIFSCAVVYKILDAAFALDDAYHEVSFQKRTVNLLVEIANYAATCESQCGESEMTTSFSNSHLVKRSDHDHELLIDEVVVTFDSGKIAKITFDE